MVDEPFSATSGLCCRLLAKEPASSLSELPVNDNAALFAGVPRIVLVPAAAAAVTLPPLEGFVGTASVPWVPAALAPVRRTLMPAKSPVAPVLLPNRTPTLVTLLIPPEKTLLN